MKNMFVIFSVNIWVSIFSQNVSVAQGTWTQKADFPGEVRYDEVGFSIGTKCYLGKGETPDAQHSLKDFWEWEQSTNIWTRKADFPGNSTSGNISFSIGTKGYIGTKNFYDQKYEFWEYDPSMDTWTQKAPIPETAEIASAVGFSIGTKGYIGTGRNAKKNNYTNEFWEWDQETNVWTQKADFAGPARELAVGFSIGNKGYIGTGMKLVQDENIAYVRYKDFWEWDQATNTWTRKADLGGSERFGSVGFSIADKGYIGAGQLGQATILNDFWEWDQASNMWKQKADYEGNAGYSAVGFSAGDKGYMVRMGFELDPSQAYYDFWEFDPTYDVTTAVNSISNQSLVEIYPNPVKDKFTIKTSALTGIANLSIFNSSGQKIIFQQILEGKTEIDVNKLVKGLYLLRLENGISIESLRLIKN